MEQIIEELKQAYNEICAYEILDITKLASKHIQSRNISEIKENKGLPKRKSSLTETIKSHHEKNPFNTFQMLQEATGFDYLLYFQCEQEVREKNLKRSNVLFLLKSLIEILESESIFVEFFKLPEIFDYIKMSASNQLKLFTYLIVMNGKITNYENREIFLPNYETILNHDYQYIDKETVGKLVNNQQLEEFFKDDNPSNPAGQRELFDVYKASRDNYTEEFMKSLELARIFKKEIDDLTKEDYQTILDNTASLSFGYLGERIIKLMKKHRKPSTKEKTPQKESKKSEEKVEPKFKQRKINQVYYEINKLYDLENFKSRTTLSLDEIIYILSLMYSIEMDTEIITKFLSSVSHEYKKNNPFAIYYQSKEKYEASNDEEVSEHLEMIKYILSDFDIFSCSDEKYIEAKSMISEEITAINQILEGNYTYEINKAKMLLKEKGE